MSMYVNGEIVEDTLISEEMERMRPQYEQVFANMEQTERENQLKQWAKENLTEQFILKQEADKRDYDVAEEVQKTYSDLIEKAGGKDKFFEERGLDKSSEDEVIKDIELQTKIRRLVSEVQDSADAPSFEEIEDYYENNKEKFVIPEMVRASHIVKHLAPGEENDEAYEELQGVLERITNGEKDFAEFAAEYSECPDQGGDLGYFARGKMVEDFEDIAFGMEVGEVSEVFRTEFGFHIAKVTDRQPERQCGLDEVKDYIENQLQEQKKEEALEKFLDKHVNKASVEEK
ncbi:Putative peptidyl-prolyl cis-trans isomerase Cbf2 precursor [Sedimentisphaera cyanobacteriorum]|uniref:peptidylprolyl isomerase n=1 Tax=Sedimentisphaera cyanobacteriorum TaxID=1940790 RepID=A0A1Q2HLX2_9BACT|nr:peptidylprolyl isomerase [Sedimentisphaera cyanobacteriorum]AQQ08487.1 Putative peptidyl-prolyl cis-trans isomerase Cbf2 precursor [Sedimentisphaera cyanobacteriorum]